MFYRKIQVGIRLHVHPPLKLVTNALFECSSCTTQCYLIFSCAPVPVPVFDACDWPGLSWPRLNTTCPDLNLSLDSAFLPAYLPAPVLLTSACTLTFLLPVAHACTWLAVADLARLTMQPFYPSAQPQHATYLVLAGHLPAMCYQATLHPWPVTCQQSNCQTAGSAASATVHCTGYLIHSRLSTCSSPSGHTTLPCYCGHCLTSSGPRERAVREASLYTSGSTIGYVTVGRKP